MSISWFSDDFKSWFDYKDIKDIVDFVLLERSLLEKDLDVFTAISSFKGFGKSSFAINKYIVYTELYGLTCKCSHKWIFTGKTLSNKSNPQSYNPDLIKENCPKCNSFCNNRTYRIDFKNDLAYDTDEFEDMVRDKPPFSFIIADEAVRFMMGEDWNTREAKSTKKLFAQMRTKHYNIVGNIPKFQWMDRKYRDDMTTFWCRIMRRGLAIILAPDLNENTDSFHINKFADLIGSYNFLTPEEVLSGKIEDLLGKHPCAISSVSLPKVPDHIYAEYKLIRDTKAFEKENNTEVVSNKDIGKIMAFNLLHNFEAISDAIVKSRDKRVTYQIISDFIVVNPYNNKSLATPPSITKWVADVQKLQKK